MKFPKWVTKATPPSKRANNQQIASNRLRYLILKLALELDRDNTLQALANHMKVSHSTISIYITRGQFSPAMAARFEDKFGRDLCPNEWLRNPLLIPSEQ